MIVCMWGPQSAEGQLVLQLQTAFFGGLPHACFYLQAANNAPHKWSASSLLFLKGKYMCLRGEGISRELELRFKARAFAFKLCPLKSCLALMYFSGQIFEVMLGDLASQFLLSLVGIFQLNTNPSN